MPLPYNYKFDETTNTYSFITKNYFEYKIVFIVDETLDIASETPIKNVYQIIVEKVTGGIESLDILVSKTIEAILGSFFKTKENSLIYICSEDNQKAKARFDVFNRWYNQSTLSSIIKVDNIIICEFNGVKYTIYTSLLYEIENPNVQNILKAYHNIEDILNEK